MKKIYILISVVVLGFIGFIIIRDGNLGRLTKSIDTVKPSEVVELKSGDVFNLTAGFVKKEIGGRTYTMFAYNGSTPGPLIKLPQGAEIRLNFKNETDLPSTIHSHGVRLDNRNDGVPYGVRGGTQKEVPPGGSFTYKIKFPDAGMYWYHPHVREDYAQELGLYGNYLVTSSDTTYWSPVNREIPLFLDDILIEKGKITLNKKRADRTLMGRYGNIVLVNGEDNFLLTVKKGGVVRLYITNAANVRPFNFAIEGAMMKLVGADGGTYERATWQDSIIINPSERAVVEVMFPESKEYALLNRTPDKTYALGKVVVSREEAVPSYQGDFASLVSNKDTIKSIDPFRPFFDKKPDKRIKLSIDMMGGMMGGGRGGHEMSGNGTSKDGIEWEDDMQMMNKMASADMVKWKIVDQGTGKENMDIDWSFKRDEPVKIRIFNDPKSTHPMQHPIHFHGQRFLVVARNGERQTNLVWKDTVLTRAGETVDILLDTSNPGEWMAHCHIAEHLESGMMFSFKVQ